MSTGDELLATAIVSQKIEKKCILYATIKKKTKTKKSLNFTKNMAEYPRRYKKERNTTSNTIYSVACVHHCSLSVAAAYGYIC
jgi:hypothetical protein